MLNANPGADAIYRSFQFGRIVDLRAALSAEDLQGLIAQARQIALTVPPSVAQVIDVLARLGTDWTDTGSRAHALICSYLSNAGIAGSSVGLFFSEIGKIFSKNVLQQRWQRAIGNHTVAPVGLVLHIGATNTLVSGIDGLVDGLLSGNVNFYKFSTPDGGFPGLFITSLLAADLDQILAVRLAAFWWKGGDPDIETLFKASVDRVIVWGGADAVINWHTGLAYSARLLSHGPKYGIGVLTTAGLQQSELKRLCKNIVMDVSNWDQKACNNLQAVFVEDSIPGPQWERFLECLYATFQEVFYDALPVRSTDDYVDIVSARELIKAESIVRGGVRLICPVENSWSMAVWSEWKSGLIPSPLCRFLHIIKFSDFSTIVHGLKQEKYWMQTMAYACSQSERENVIGMAKVLGLTRICDFGDMILSSSIEPHDGGYDLSQLVNMIAV